MSNKERDILRQLENEDTEDVVETSSRKNNENSFGDFASDKFDMFNKKWDDITVAFFNFMKKNFKKKKSEKNYNRNEAQKHNQIFKKIFRFFWLIIGIFLVATLIYAFFKVVVFSNEINKKEKRVIEKKEVMELGKDIGGDWKTKVFEDIKRNKNSIDKVKKTINNIDTKNQKRLEEIKDLIKSTSLETKKTYDESMQGIKSEIYSYVDKNVMDKVSDIKKELKNVKHEGNHLGGTFMEIPKKVQKINNNSIAEHNASNLAKETQQKEHKKLVEQEEHKKLVEQEEHKKLVEQEKDIYYSINIEDIPQESSSYDNNGSEESNDNNKTLPPFVLRQGLTNGVLVTGISAPTFSDTKKNPAPVFITFKGSSIISNMFEQDVENCTATGSTFGNIITRRAEILINNISCTYKKDGKMYMVRNNVKGWIYDGNDGRYGIPGILVDHSGTILNDSVIIGLLKGFGDFVSSSAQIFASQGKSSIALNGSPMYSPAQVAQTNLAGGVGKQLASGFDTITDYYQKIIDQLYPYIDVKGGRKVTIFFDGGETLTPKEYRPFLVNDMDKYSRKNNHNDENNDNMELEVNVDEW